MIGAPLTVQEYSLPRFQNVSQAARTLKISRRTVQRNAPEGSDLRDKRGLVDVKKLEAKLWIGAPLGAPRKAGYPAGVPRRESGSKGQSVWAARDRARKAKAERAARQRLKRRRGKQFPANAGIPFTVEGVILRFTGWRKFVESRDPIATWDTERLTKIKRLMSVFLEFAADIESLIRRKDAEGAPSSGLRSLDYRTEETSPRPPSGPEIGTGEGGCHLIPNRK